MTVNEFYIAMGKAGDWNTRRKIEKALFTFKISLRDELTDEVAEAIAKAECSIY